MYNDTIFLSFPSWTLKKVICSLELVIQGGAKLIIRCWLAAIFFYMRIWIYNIPLIRSGSLNRILECFRIFKIHTYIIIYSTSHKAESMGREKWRMFGFLYEMEADMNIANMSSYKRYKCVYMYNNVGGRQLQYVMYGEKARARGQ